MAKKEDIEKQVAAMEKLGFSKEEIADILKIDAEIDHGGNPFPLAPELEKAAKKAMHCGTRKTPEKVQRTRKKNTIKAEIIEKLYDFLQNDTIFQNLTITNSERMLNFNVNGQDFDLTLIQKRKKE